MSNRPFQGLVVQMHDTIHATIGVVDETATIIACSDPNKVGTTNEFVSNDMNESGDLFIRDIVARIPNPKPSYNTVATQVKFLEDKGFLTRKPMANSFCYYPAFTEKEYRGSTLGDFVERYYDNSYSLLVSQFVEDDKMDLEELKQLIATIESKRK